ncbi:MAG: hypothetical protein E5W82_21595 [Mesorhizobium sp.]|nr:MAG: hypothetical protein E5W82_21595 [Mesorhizobium sp.]TJW41650.1 MAG: hypothetical protein E5W83_25165 [Mesorhizobium sp.]
MEDYTWRFRRKKKIPMTGHGVSQLILSRSRLQTGRGDRQRQWKGKDGSGRERLFKIEDEQFWQLVANDSLRPHIFDTMKVQWAFRTEGGKPKDTRIMRVLEYNETVLAAPLDDNALGALLGQYADEEDGRGGSDHSNDLFGRIG